jgi:uncharacterized repeat protein (TIGR01451 family)
VREGQGAQEGQVREAAEGQEDGSSSRRARPRRFKVSAPRYNHAGPAALRALAALCCSVAFAAVAPASASAFVDNPAWTVSALSNPTNFAPGDRSGEASYLVVVTNTGTAPSNGEPVVITDKLPAGVVLDAHRGISGVERPLVRPVSCTGLTCTLSGALPAGAFIELSIPVEVETTTLGLLPEANVVSVSGGGVADASTSTPTTISDTPSPGFGIAPGSFSTTLSSTQAGAHADVTTSFYFNTATPFVRGGETDGQIKDTVADLPAGFAGDPLAYPTCTEDQLHEGFFGGCPLNSQVGQIAITLGGPALLGDGLGPALVPVYNMAPLGGEVTRLGFNILGTVSNIIIKVRPGSYGLEALSPNLNAGTIEVQATKLTVWGEPGDHNHDLMRGTVCFDDVNTGPLCFGPNFTPLNRSEGVASTTPDEPFLSNPTQCTSTPLPTELRTDTWQDPEQLSAEGELGAATASVPPITGCEHLEFNPSMSVAPTSDVAETPSGLDVGLSIPQTYENPSGLATSALKNTTVTLPAGVTINPSAGEGLGVCTEAEYKMEAVETPPGEGCPNDSSLATVSSHTPVLREELTGSAYLAQPYDNPFSEPGHPTGSLVALYVVMRIPARGLIAKLAGKVTLNPVTGQLTTTFTESPPLPFDKFVFNFRSGEAAPLVNPPVCGSYRAQSVLASWAEPSELVSSLSAPFEITQGVGGGACPAGGVPPFHPQVVSGTLSNASDTYSPFYLRIVRGDGEQEITKFTTVLPRGLTGNLSGIPYCPDADIEAARHVTGAQELREPSCPAASEIGHTTVGAGVGGVLAQTPGKIYLAGPYHGGSLSVVSITSATVGPFDLGTVVIRFALDINPLTAQVEINGSTSDPIPHIIDGVVVHVRDIRVYINREKFILNPTNCDPMSISTTITGTGANYAIPADQMSVTDTTPFQTADCANLTFKPTFKASTSGRTSKADGASLTARLSYPGGLLGVESNIASVKVELPKQLPSRLTTLQQACTLAQFEANPAGCPAASVVGRARAITPLIPGTLEGPAYFVSHGGEAFPSLIVMLQGDSFTIELVGTTFINKAGITSSTFKTVPDQPVGSFELTFPQGKYSALAANGNLCKSRLTMPTTIVAQNGDEIRQATPISVTGCTKKKQANRASRARKASHRNANGRKS